MIIKLKNNSDLILKKDGVTTEVIDSVNRLAKGHEYVEIGGIKWATMNLGATGITDGGILFAWGETNGFLPSQVGTERHSDGMIINSIQVMMVLRLQNISQLMLIRR